MVVVLVVLVVPAVLVALSASLPLLTRSRIISLPTQCVEQGAHASADKEDVRRAADIWCLVESPLGPSRWRGDIDAIEVCNGDTYFIELKPKNRTQGKLDLSERGW